MSTSLPPRKNESPETGKKSSTTSTSDPNLDLHSYRYEASEEILGSLLIPGWNDENTGLISNVEVNLEVGLPISIREAMLLILKEVE